MHSQRKSAPIPNGVLPASIQPGNFDKSNLNHQSRRRNYRDPLSSSDPDQLEAPYNYPQKRQQYNHQSSSLARQQHRKPNSDFSTQPSYRHHDSVPEVVPEPDYSQTDTESDEIAARLRNPSFWTPRSYYNRTGSEDQAPPPRDRNGDIHQSDLNLNSSTFQKKRPQWQNEPEFNPTGTNPRRQEYSDKTRSLLGRKSRANEDDRGHITTINLDAESLRRANGGPFVSFHNRDDFVDQDRRAHYRRNSEQTATDIRSISSPPAVPPQFSNVNLLKKVNDRYKLTERLLLQLKIIAVLHAFFGFAMFSLDSSQTIVLWPYVEDARERLYLFLRIFYSIGVILIGCLTIAVSCGKRAAFQEIVKILCAVYVTTLLAAPSETPFFRSIADSLQYNNALRRFQIVGSASGDQVQKRFADFPGAQDDPITQSTLEETTRPSFRSFPNSVEHKTTKRRHSATTPRRRQFFNDASEEQGATENEDAVSSPVTNSPRTIIDADGSQKEDQRKPTALRVAQHLRIAYAIFTCCHILLTIGTLIILARLEKIS